jgi:hypothetical protein
MNAETAKYRNKYFWVLIVCSVLLAGLLCAKLVGFLAASTTAGGLFGRTALQEKMGTENTIVDDSQRMADDLKKNNLFMSAVQSDCPIKEVSGIMGSEVLIKRQWYKVGDRIDGAIILAVEPSYIRIKWEGGEKILAPAEAASEQSWQLQAAGRKSDALEAGTENQTQRTPTAVAAGQPQTTGEAAQNREDQLAWLGVELTAEQRQKAELLWSRMSEQVKEMMRQRWSMMPEEERMRTLQQLDQMPIDQLEQMFEQVPGQTQ